MGNPLMSDAARQERIAELLREAAAASASADLADDKGHYKEATNLRLKHRRLSCEAYVLQAGTDINNGGRPSKFTVPVLSKILEAARAGATYSLICQYAGIHPDTLSEWLKRAENGDDGFIGFSDHLQREIAAVGMDALEAWRGHFAADFKAPRDFLARRFPAEWSPTIKQQVTTDAKPAQALTIVIQGADVSQLNELMQHSRSFLAPGQDEHSAEPPAIIDGTAREIEEAGQG